MPFLSDLESARATVQDAIDLVSRPGTVDTDALLDIAARLRLVHRDLGAVIAAQRGA